MTVLNIYSKLLHGTDLDVPMSATQDTQEDCEYTAANAGS